MKKFGTPSGAGPGKAKEKVGLEGVGTPPAPRIGPGLGGAVVVPVEPVDPLPEDFEPLPELPEPFEEDEPPLCDEGFCDCEGPVVFGGDWGVVPGEDGDVEVVEDVLVVGGGGVGVEAGGAWQDSEMPMIGRVTGREIEDNGVPGGTLTVKFSFAPPATVTVITHVSAEAVGSAAIPNTPSTDATVTATIHSFRLLNTMA